MADSGQLEPANPAAADDSNPVADDDEGDNAKLEPQASGDAMENRAMVTGDDNGQGDEDEEDEEEEEQEEELDLDDDDFEFVIDDRQEDADDDDDVGVDNAGSAAVAGSAAATGGETAASSAVPRARSLSITARAPVGARPPANTISRKRSGSVSAGLAAATQKDAVEGDDMNPSNYSEFIARLYPPGVPRKRTAFDVNLNNLDDHPWRRPGARTEDFFNYGLDESRWKKYAFRQVAIRLREKSKTSIKVFDNKSVSPAHRSPAMSSFNNSRPRPPPGNSGSPGFPPGSGRPQVSSSGGAPRPTYPPGGGGGQYPRGMPPGPPRGSGGFGRGFPLQGGRQGNFPPNMNMFGGGGGRPPNNNNFNPRGPPGFQGGPGMPPMARPGMPPNGGMQQPRGPGMQQPRGPGMQQPRGPRPMHQ